MRLKRTLTTKILHNDSKLIFYKTGEKAKILQNQPILNLLQFFTNYKTTRIYKTKITKPIGFKKKNLKKPILQNDYVHYPLPTTHYSLPTTTPYP
jgi:hypothetical protein